MAGFDGTGNFVPPTPPTYPAVAGTTIEAGKFNTILNSIVAALSQCIVKDGQSATSGPIKFAQGVKTDSITSNVSGEVLFDGASAAIGMSSGSGSAIISFQDPTDTYNEAGSISMNVDTLTLNIDAGIVTTARLGINNLQLSASYGTAVAGAKQSPVSAGSGANAAWRTNCQWEEVWSGVATSVATSAFSCGDIEGLYLVANSPPYEGLSIMGGYAKGNPAELNTGLVSFNGGVAEVWSVRFDGSTVVLRLTQTTISTGVIVATDRTITKIYRLT